MEGPAQRQLEGMSCPLLSSHLLVGASKHLAVEMLYSAPSKSPEGPWLAGGCIHHSLLPPQQPPKFDG